MVYMEFVEKVRVNDTQYIQERYLRTQARLMHLLFGLDVGRQPYVSLANNEIFVAIFSKSERYSCRGEVH